MTASVIDAMKTALVIRMWVDGRRVAILTNARAGVFALVALLSSAAPAAAQHEHPEPSDKASEWTWSASGQAFLTANLQEREFRDFHQVESQNWFMGSGTRRLGSSTLSLHGMASLEPLTLRRLGSSQVFQTGETLDRAPLIDYQHPHDLIMNLSARLTMPARGTRVTVSGGLVDEPALGPTAFMHRASAAPNPTVPLSHHQLDSTHISYGVVTVGVMRGEWSGEASVFRGREPDENRYDLDLGAFDSWSTRFGWQRGGLRAQASGAHLRTPDAIEPGNITRLTASIEYAGTMLGRSTAVTAAWGQNRASYGKEDAYLFEAVSGISGRGEIYARAELVDKHILTAGGPHPPGFQHPHVFSRVGALTGGYLFRLGESRAGEIAVGGDVTGYRVPGNLAASYGHPASIHLFVRWRRV
jgi:hypothetical protein